MEPPQKKIQAMSIRSAPERRLGEGAGERPSLDGETLMAHKNREKDLLWNISLLPTVKTAASFGPPSGPSPAGGSALPAPALLSVSDVATPELELAA